jgi:hypothetical protein
MFLYADNINDHCQSVVKKISTLFESINVRLRTSKKTRAHPAIDRLPLFSWIVCVASGELLKIYTFCTTNAVDAHNMFACVLLVLWVFSVLLNHFDIHSLALQLIYRVEKNASHELLHNNVTFVLKETKRSSAGS